MVPCQLQSYGHASSSTESGWSKSTEHVKVYLPTLMYQNKFLPGSSVAIRYDSACRLLQMLQDFPPLAGHHIQDRRLLTCMQIKSMGKN